MKAEVWLQIHTTLDLCYNDDDDDDDNNNNLFIYLFIYLVFQISTEGPNTIVYGVRWKCEEPFQVTDMNEPKLAQKNKLLYKWFRVKPSEGKPIIELSVIKKAVILRWNESNWQLHILGGMVTKFKTPAPAGHIQM
jgi:hypothetical protein